MKLLVTGSKGMLGLDLVPRLEVAGFDLQCVDVEELDITRKDDVFRAVKSCRPELVINCAAYTAVDKAESEPKLATAVNRDGVAHLAEACKQSGVPLIHISTDYVFDGRSPRPYREEDAANPVGVYAKSKWEGEEEVRRIWARHIIIRTSWLFGFYGNNFVKTILRLAGERVQLRIVSDQYGCPTWTGHLSDAIVAISRRMRENREQFAWGTYHYCGKEATTWHGFASVIVDEARKRTSLKVSEVLPIPTSEYPTPAKRPPNSVLDCGKIRENFAINPASWQEGLRVVLDQLLGREKDSV